jgi:hypothetical protein
MLLHRDEPAGTCAVVGDIGICRVCRPNHAAIKKRGKVDRSRTRSRWNDKCIRALKGRQE